jgi:tripartite-type tricarboxylate transporter receptor subunit TctC
MTAVSRPVLPAALMSAGLLIAAPAQADPADFYRGKTVEVLVGFSAGGGYDAYARVLARTLGNHIPGKPLVVVKNFTGAGWPATCRTQHPATACRLEPSTPRC